MHFAGVGTPTFSRSSVPSRGMSSVSASDSGVECLPLFCLAHGMADCQPSATRHWDIAVSSPVPLSSGFFPAKPNLRPIFVAHSCDEIENKFLMICC